MVCRSTLREKQYRTYDALYPKYSMRQEILTRGDKGGKKEMHEGALSEDV